MGTTRRWFLLALSAMAGLLVCTTTRAAVLLDTTAALSAADPTQLGRLSRNGVSSDWSTAKPFPGVINTGISYHFRTFTVDPNVLGTPFIQVSVDDPQSAIFISAYLDSYSPSSVPPNNGLDTNYLGDTGQSGNNFGNPAFFQVIVPAGHLLVLAANDVIGNGGGLGQTFGLLVEGFIDTEFTDPAAAAPEPSTAVLSATGLAILALARVRARRRRRA
jgi:hypothetical protein